MDVLILIGVLTFILHLLQLVSVGSSNELPVHVEYPALVVHQELPGISLNLDLPVLGLVVRWFVVVLIGLVSMIVLAPKCLLGMMILGVDLFVIHFLVI